MHCGYASRRAASRSLGIVALLFGAGIGIAPARADAQCQATKLFASDPGADHRFGSAVAIDGDYIVVGAPRATSLVAGEGAAYVFKRNGASPTGWSFLKKLSASDALSGDNFGNAVAIAGSTIVIGAIFDDDNCSPPSDCNTGSAYVFQRDFGGADNWGQIAKLVSPSPNSNAFFGQSVAIAGDDIIVGAHGATGGGAADVFRRDQGGADNWGHVQTLARSNATVFDQFGFSVSMSGSAAIVSAHKQNNVGSSSGAAYAYSRTVAPIPMWIEEDHLIPSDAVSGDNFGYDVAVDTVAGLAVIGAPFEDTNGLAAGSVYIYSSTTGFDNWTETTKLFGSGTDNDDQLGISVAIDDFAVAGAYYDEEASGNGGGSAFIFTSDANPGPSWGELAKLLPADPNSGINYGWDVAIDGSTIVIGARFQSEMAASAGAAYVLEGGGPDCNDNLICDDVEIALGAVDDQNSNGIPDECECPADLTDDDQVNADDLFALLGAWGPCPACPEDLTGDDNVNADDLFALLGAWGPC